MLHRFIILIVHDEPLIARKFQEILGVRWSVIFVGTAPKIIEHTLHTKPHLIICDVEFFSNLRKILDNEIDNTNIPIICISDFDTIGYEIAAFEAGAIDFLKQPFVPEIIRARVERILQWRIETNVLRQTVVVNKDVASSHATFLSSSGSFRSGFSQTSLLNSQSRVDPVQRSG